MKIYILNLISCFVAAASAYPVLRGTEKADSGERLLKKVKGSTTAKTQTQNIPAQASACTDGQCLQSDGTCADPEVSCFVNPCDVQNACENGKTCVWDHCQGTCNAECV